MLGEKVFYFIKSSECMIKACLVGMAKVINSMLSKIFAWF